MFRYSKRRRVPSNTRFNMSTPPQYDIPDPPTPVILPLPSKYYPHTHVQSVSPFSLNGVPYEKKEFRYILNSL